MPNSAAEPTLEMVFTKLREGRDAYAWPKRCEIAAQVAEALLHGPRPSYLQDLLWLLADDPKWEVRKVVAEHLHLVADDRFADLAAKLGSDVHDGVRRAVEIALERRRLSEEQTQRRMRGVEHVSDRLQALERQHGKAIAGEVLKVGQEFFDHLVSPAVHDMRNAVLALSGQMDEIDRKGKASVREPVRLARKRLDHLQRLIDDMLVYAKVGKIGFRTERLQPLVAEAQKTALDALAAKGYHIATPNLADGVPDVLAVPVSKFHVHRALTNVIKNGCEAYSLDRRRKNACHLALEVRQANGSLVLAVADKGRGMSELLLSKVRTFTFGNSTKGVEGTGIALPMARRFIRAHGGDLTIDSAKGKGTTVTITLPLEQETDDG